jgi:hypothetical protein
MLVEKTTEIPIVDNLTAGNQESLIEEEVMENDVPDEELPDWIKDIGGEEAIKGEVSLPLESEILETDQDEISELFSEETQFINRESVGQPVDDFSSWLTEVQSEAKTVSGDIEFENSEGLEDLPDWLKGIGTDKQTNEHESQDVSTNEFPSLLEDFSSTQDQFEPTLEANAKEKLPDWLNEIGLSTDEKPSSEEIVKNLDVQSTTYPMDTSEKDTQDNEVEPEPEGVDSKEELPTLIIEEQLQPQESMYDGSLSLDDQDEAMAWLESLAARQGANPEELLTKPEERKEEPPEWVKINNIEETGSYDDEESISLQADNVPLSFVDPVDNKTSSDSDMHAEVFPEVEENIKDLESEGQSEFVGSNVISSKDQEVNNAETFQNEPEQPIDVSKPEPAVANLPESDVAQWLKGMDASDSKNEEKSIAPKVAEFYGNEVSEPLPDWLSEIAGETTTSEWIPESDNTSDLSTGKNNSELIPDEKDIDDIGEIFPTDSTNWAFEESESGQELEPLNEVVKPVTTSEWHPSAEKERISIGEDLENSDTGSFPSANDAPHISETIGTGMLSKIPAKDIEKEAGTLERAQSFIENGDLKKAIDVYSRLIKKGQLLEGVIHDLRETTYRYPLEIGIWQSLGDAYMRSNQLQDALDAYTRAEELLR